MAGGRPLKFKTVEELEVKIESYFESCLETKEPITVTGLALWLDTTRDTLMDYQNRDEFSDAIKKAKLRVENDYEKALRTNGKAGDIFGLKNFGWKDVQQRELTGANGGSIVVAREGDKGVLEKLDAPAD